MFLPLHQLLIFFQGKRLVFVTNNSTKSRKQYGKKFETLGLNVNEVSDLIHNLATLSANKSVFDYSIILFSQEEIFASSFAAAAYLQSINFPKDKKVSFIQNAQDSVFGGTMSYQEYLFMSLQVLIHFYLGLRDW